jgi:TusA-related sulfurtransferase
MRSHHAPTRLSVSSHLVDARQKACPLPIIELAKALRTAELVELWATDPAAPADLDAFAQATGHHIEQVRPAPFAALVRNRNAAEPKGSL